MADLLLYRRHSEDCSFLSRGRSHTKCSCPVWCDGRIRGKRIHRSLKTRDWDRAERRMLELDRGRSVARVHLIKIAAADYIEDCRARSLAPSTVASYAKSLEALTQFCAEREILHCEQISLQVITEFRAALKGKPGRQGATLPAALPKTQRKVLETLRAFFRFCEARDWMHSNPAKDLKPPKDFGIPTLPFGQHEVAAILSAIPRVENPNRASAARARLRTRAILLTMLYSGLRISDVALLRRDRVDPDSGRLLVRMMKTGTPLYVKLPPGAIESLAAVPVESKKYFFWTGNGKTSSVIGSLRRSIDCVLKLAEIDGHPHRFRDTFAVRLLEADTPIRTVQLLLGHSSVQTTERHYAPYVQSQQRLLDAATDKLDFGDSPFGARALGEKTLQRRRRNA